MKTMSCMQKRHWFVILVIWSVAVWFILYASLGGKRGLVPYLLKDISSVGKCAEVFDFLTDLSDAIAMQSPVVNKTNSPSEYSQESGAGWQTITSKNETFYVYSAFYDNYDVKRPVLLLVGLRLLKRQFPMPATFCTIRGDANGTANTSAITTSVEASFSDIPEHHSEMYTAVFITCPLPTPDIHPRTVNLSLSKAGETLVSLRVVYPNPEPPKNFTVCYPALFNYWNPRGVMEAIELSRLMGAEHIVAYRHNVTPAVDAVLEHYVNQGFLQLLPWNVPDVPVHYHGQMAVINDCLHRSFRNTRYLIVCDFDEVIVPSKGRNWSQLVRDLHLHESKHGAALFRSAFFDVDQGQRLTPAERFKADLFGLKSLLLTGRMPEPFPWGQRTKSILLPDRVVTGGIHSPYTFRPGVTGSLNVEPSQALVNHYRTFNNSRQTDASLLHLSGNLLSSVQDTWRQICLQNEEALERKSKKKPVL